MFYVISSEYVGPNDKPNSHVVYIASEPAKKNMSREICTDGWCGTTNDYSVHAHGEYETIESARESIKNQFGAVRDTDDGGEDAIETYLVGEFEEMDKDNTETYIYDGMIEYVSATTTDDEIAALVEKYEKDANDNGLTLGDADEIMTEYRDRLREEAEEEA